MTGAPFFSDAGARRVVSVTLAHADAEKKICKFGGFGENTWIIAGNGYDVLHYQSANLKRE